MITRPSPCKSPLLLWHHFFFGVGQDRTGIPATGNVWARLTMLVGSLV